MKLQAIDSSRFCDKSHFEDDGMENYLVFQAVYRHLKKIANSNNILAWKSKWLSYESVTTPVSSNNSHDPVLNYINTKSWVKFDRICLKQDRATFTNKNVVIIYIVYEINLRLFNVFKDFEWRNTLMLLRSLKMLILISISILVIVLDLMHTEVCRYQIVVVW